MHLEENDMFILADLELPILTRIIPFRTAYNINANLYY